MEVAELQFEVFSQRYERGSTILTSNLPFDEWINVSARRTRYNATVLERLSPRIRVIDPTHPFFDQLLEVSTSRPSRRTGWIQVVLPDGRHRWIPQKATDLEDVACEITRGAALRGACKTMRPKRSWRVENIRG